MYSRFIKRWMDFFLALVAFIFLSPLLLVLTIVGAVIMRGNPFFAQVRPGKGEKLFKLLKFRTMTNSKDENGQLLPDEQRLVAYGRFLRSTSLDELPQLINIILGQMSIVGPRPQLVADMLFMTDVQRKRHTVRPGLTGLAQCSGRNHITWEQKFGYDLQYIENVTFCNDIVIILKTVVKVFSRDGINTEGMITTEDLGKYLLRKGEIAQSDYDRKQEESRLLLAR